MNNHVSSQKWNGTKLFDSYEHMLNVKKCLFLSLFQDFHLKHKCKVLIYAFIKLLHLKHQRVPKK